MPITARVYSDLELARLKVDFDILLNEPTKILLDLGKYLLNGNPFPNVDYYQNGQPSEAVDVGGVRRDLVTRLFDNLFKEHNKGLPFNANSGRVIPRMSDNTDPNCYKTIGRLLALCARKDSSFKSGPIFPTIVFELIKDIGDKDPSSFTDDDYLKYWGMISGFETLDFNTLKNWFENPPENSKTFNDLTENCGYESAEEILDIAKKDKHAKEILNAIHLMAQEMKKALGDAEWDKLTQMEGADLSDQIQGVLNVDSLIEKLKWEPSPAVDSNDLAKIKGWLEDWIKKADKQKLENFLWAVTSLKTLGSDPVKIYVYNREADFIPIAHTCFFALELSAEYPDSTAFEEQLETFLLNSLAGTGFQMI